MIDTPSSVTVTSTLTPCRPIGWHSGIRSGVRLAPAIPAMRATASASPLGTCPARSAATASADSSTRPDAHAAPSRHVLARHVHHARVTRVVDVGQARRFRS